MEKKIESHDIDTLHELVEEELKKEEGWKFAYRYLDQITRRFIAVLRKEVDDKSKTKSNVM